MTKRSNCYDINLQHSFLFFNQSRVNAAKLHRIEALHTKQQAVLKRKTEEADAARKRLKVRSIMSPWKELSVYFQVNCKIFLIMGEVQLSAVLCFSKCW